MYSAPFICEIDGNSHVELFACEIKLTLVSFSEENSFLLTYTKLRVQRPGLSEQPVPAPDGRDGVLHRVRGRAVQRGGAAPEALRRPQ